MFLSRRAFLGTGVALAAVQVDAAPGPESSTPSHGAPGCTDRMPEISSDRQTEAQRKASVEFAAGRGVPVFGPFVPLLRSPEVMLRTRSRGRVSDLSSLKSSPARRYM